MFTKHKLYGYVDYPEVGRITDEAVYQTVVKHSRLIDRLNPRKMLDMSFQAQLILMKVIEPDSNDPNWKFFDKKHK